MGVPQPSIALRPLKSLFPHHGYVNQEDSMRRHVSAAIGTLSTLSCIFISPGTAAAADSNLFSMVRSQSVVNADCAQNARGRVTINSLGPVEVMHVEATGLPPNREFDLF